MRNLKLAIMSKRPRDDDFLSSSTLVASSARARSQRCTTRSAAASHGQARVAQHPDAATVAALERDVLRAIGAHKHIVSLVEYAETADAYALASSCRGRRGF